MLSFQSPNFQLITVQLWLVFAYTSLRRAHLWAFPLYERLQRSIYMYQSGLKINSHILTSNVHWKMASNMRGTSSIIAALYLQATNRKIN